MVPKSKSNLEFSPAQSNMDLTVCSLTMTWEQATRFIYQREGKQELDLFGLDRLKIAAEEMGYEIKVTQLDEGGGILDVITLWRDGVDSHTFYLEDKINIALQFLRAELIYNGSYYPNEEKDWSVEGLKALCLTLEELQRYPNLPLRY